MTPEQRPDAEPLPAVPPLTADPLFALSKFARHRPWCPEFNGPGDCTCGLYALLETILCTCGHTVRHHTNRDVSDVVGWPCSDCKSERCRGFDAARAAPDRAGELQEIANRVVERWNGPHEHDPQRCAGCAALLSDSDGLREGLDVAWAEAEAALPYKRNRITLEHTDWNGDFEAWVATADSTPFGGDARHEEANGTTHAAALRALAARLRDQP